MSTMNISLPEELKAFVDQQVGSRGYTSSSEYVRELIRRERDREKLRGLIVEGMDPPLSGVVADKAYFDGLRSRIRDRAAGAKPAAPGAPAPAAARVRKATGKGAGR